MPKIKKITAEKILGFRGKETIKVRVEDDQGRTASAAIPFGKSEGQEEAKYLAPAQAELKAAELSRLLVGREVFAQQEIDELMIAADGTPRKEGFGGNLILGTSLACARLAALQLAQPFYAYLYQLFFNQEFVFKAPQLLFNLVEGGVHSQTQLPIQEHLVIPPVQSVKFQLEFLRRVVESFRVELETAGEKIGYGDEGGWELASPSEDQLFSLLESIRVKNQLQFDWGIDAAANNIKNFDPVKYLAWYQRLAKDYPLVYLEDPFFETGQEGYWQEVLSQLGRKTLIVGDDLTVTNPKKLSEMLAKKMINGIIIKPDQVGSLTEVFQTVRLARKGGLKIVVSHRSQETTDDYLADLAIGIQADFVKFGAFYQGERLAKYNRLLEIESAAIRR